MAGIKDESMQLWGIKYWDPELGQWFRREEPWDYKEPWEIRVDPSAVAKKMAAEKYLRKSEQPMQDIKSLKSPLLKQAGGSHYKDFAIQPAVYSQRNKLGWAEGNVVKYISRYKLKGGLEDLKKAKHMIDLIMELEYDYIEGEETDNASI
jgi:hypothetical protein